MHMVSGRARTLQASDLIIAVGSRFDDRTTGLLGKYAPVAKAAAAEGKGGFVHFDIEPSQIGRVLSATVAVAGDCKGALQTLLPMVDPGTASTPARQEWARHCEDLKEKFPFSYTPCNDNKIKTQQVIEALYKGLRPQVRKSVSARKGITLQINAGYTVPRCWVPNTCTTSFLTHVLTYSRADLLTYSPSPLLPYSPTHLLTYSPTHSLPQEEKMVVSTGVGNHQMMSCQFIRWTQPRSIITSGSLGTMGFGLPAAIGAQVANPDKMVVLIDGDSSFNMTLNDLGTAVDPNPNPRPDPNPKPKPNPDPGPDPNPH